MHGSGKATPEAGVPKVLFSEDGYGLTPPAREAELAPENDKLLKPCLTINQKLIEFNRSHEAFPCYLSLPPVRKLDHC